MTDIQILTITISVLLVFGGSWFNSSRVGDVGKRVDDMRDLLRAEIKAEGATLRTEFVQLRADLTATLVRIENKLDHYAEVQATHSERLDKLENRG